MKLKIFTAYDSKVEAYLQPFFMRSTGEAIRAWTELANNSEHLFCKHPADYTLFEIGEYDDTTGQVVPNMTFKNLGTALEFKRQTVDTEPTLPLKFQDQAMKLLKDEHNQMVTKLTQ